MKWDMMGFEREDGMITIDGSQGEGGGQILRSALTLSIMTGRTLYIKNIRAQRPKPGLQHQHLQAVKAAAAVSKANVSGAFLNADELEFEPGEISSGRYRFDIGTAGSTILVLQTIFLPLAFAGSASTVDITGGTHVPWSPCYHYLDLQWLPFLKKLGFDAQLSLESAGFYPQGNGRVRATIRPAEQVQPLQVTRRGELQAVTGVTGVANLEISIADRQRRQALRRLQDARLGKRPPKIKTDRMPGRFKGTVLLLCAEFEYGQACFFGLGERGKPAERVADEAVDQLFEFLNTEGAVDPYLADQLLLPLAFAAGKSAFTTSKVTTHLQTNAAIIRVFEAAEVIIDGEIGQTGLVSVHPAV